MNTNSSEELLLSIIGKTPWQVSAAADSVVSMEFGLHDPRQSGVKIHGEWSLWLYFCAWRIETSQAVLVGSEDSLADIRNVLKNLSWEPIRDLTLLKPALDLDIMFGDSFKLRTFAVNSDRSSDEQWILYTPRLKTLIARGSMLVLEEQPLAIPETGSLSQ